MAVSASVQAFYNAQTAFNTAMSADIDDLAAKIKTQNDTITALQNSAGTVSAEDQALIDKLQADGAALQAKVDALDGKTPPTPPAA